MSERLRIDRIACTGHGACAELLPEAVALDEWGYPLLAAGELPRDLHRPARRAVAACPARALLLERTDGRQPLPGAFTGSTQGRPAQ